MTHFISHIISSLILISLLCFSCQNTEEQPVGTSQQEQKKSLEKANKYLVISESEQIAEYVERHHLEMTETGTGLRFQIRKQGSEEPIRVGDEVFFEYETRFLNGTVVYSSKTDGEKSFIVGRGGVESGLEECMKYLHLGDVAIAILPSHLAFGLLGDSKKIPQKATLVYHLKITKVISKNN